MLDLIFSKKQPENINWQEKFATKDKLFYKTPFTKILTNGEQLIFAESKDIVFRTWDGEAHRELAKILGSQKVKDDFANGKLFKKVLHVLQFMCIRFAGKDLWIPNSNGGFQEAMKEHERRAWIAKHYETDVMTAYILLHINSRGEMMSLPIEHNEAEVNVSFDLNEIEYYGSDNIEDGLFYYKLARPINIRGKEITHMILGPSTFQHISEVPLNADLEKSNYDVMSFLASVIYYLPEISNDRVIVNSRELNRLQYLDIKNMQQEVAKHYIGINMFVEFEDPELKEKFKQYLPWYDTNFLV